MFGMKKKYKKRTWTKKTYSKPATSRVDKIINILETADRKDKAEGSISIPKRKYTKSNKHKRGNFSIGW